MDKNQYVVPRGKGWAIKCEGKIKEQQHFILPGEKQLKRLVR